MHDPESLAHRSSPACGCVAAAAEKEAQDRAKKLEMHLRYERRMAPIRERDRRWRRVNQAILGTVALAGASVLFTVLWTVSRYLDGESLGVVDTLASKLTLGGVFTTLGVLRMLWHWHKRRAAPAAQRAADAAASLLPTSR